MRSRSGFTAEPVGGDDDHPRVERPLISVVIPTHQRAPLLERSLESLTVQTLPARRGR